MKEEVGRAKSFGQVRMTTREKDDLIMMGIGAFSPVEGFTGGSDWKGVCDEMRMANGIFWPIPIGNALCRPKRGIASRHIQTELRSNSPNCRTGSRWGG